MKRRKLALITGASKGIGAALAYEFASHNFDLILIARSEELLKDVAIDLTEKYGIKATVLVLDLSQHKEVQKTMLELVDKTKIDVLVNNAGFGLRGPFAETSLYTELNMIDVNNAAMVELTKYVLPGMIKRKSGKVLNVASTAAFQPGPLMAVYFASKAFIVSFSEAINNELKGTGVQVKVLCPGPTRTHFAERAKVANTNLFSRSRTATPEAVARFAYNKLMSSNKTVLVPGRLNNLGSIAVRFLPRSWTFYFMRGVHENVNH